MTHTRPQRANVSCGSTCETRGEYFTSAMPSITDIARTSQDVRLVPIADMQEDEGSRSR
jgi:hypothetical protein